MLTITHSNPAATYQPGYCPREKDFLVAKVRKTWLPGQPLEHVVQIVVTTSEVALDMDLTQEVPQALEELLSGAPLMQAVR